MSSKVFATITNKDILDEIKELRNEASKDRDKLFKGLATLQTQQNNHEQSDKFHHRLQYILGGAITLTLVSLFGITKIFPGALIG